MKFYFRIILIKMWVKIPVLMCDFYCYNNLFYINEASYTQLHKLLQHKV